MSSYVPAIPSDKPVVISRQVFAVLALVDISLPARRILDMLMSLHDEDTGVAEVSQSEMCRLIGANKPTVNRGFKELRECGLAWLLKASHYQVHPALTGAAAGPMAVPEIKSAAPEALNAQRRERFAAQVANLAHSA
ncbi:helix-turn-helix domain-containing protein [Kitasatospora sp. NPDC001175]|uniref:helix-turn-helix domain-containing protein n=1 Tax=Kitasatospora sp. NPDC001175 TaxID=3157103 RepID=UPI003CFF2BD9